jgi:hypothetical protein
MRGLPQVYWKAARRFSSSQQLVRGRSVDRLSATPSSHWFQDRADGIIRARNRHGAGLGIGRESMKSLVRLFALGVVACAAQAQPTTSENGFEITKTQTVTNAPAAFVGRKTTDRETRVGNTPETRGDSSTIVLTVGGFVRACPTAEGVVAGTFEYAISRDDVDDGPGGTQTKRSSNRILATLKGHVKDDGMLDYIEIEAEVMRELDGMPPEQRTVSRRFRLGEGGQPDTNAMRDAVLATANLSIAVVMWMGATIYSEAQTRWNTVNECVEFHFDPPTNTRTLGPNESVDVRTELRTKEDGAPVFGGGLLRVETLAGIGSSTPRGDRELPSDSPFTVTYTASAAPRAGHGFYVGARTRAGIGEAKWLIRPAVRFEGTFSQSQNSSVGPADLAGALPPGLPPGLGAALGAGAARYGIGATMVSEISGTLVWTPEEGAQRAKTFGDVDSTFYVPTDGEITVDVKSVGQSNAGACTINGNKTFSIRSLPPPGRQFLVLEVAADGRYKMMLGMISYFLQFQATQTCRVRRRETNEPVIVNDAGVVIGPQQGSLTADGIAGETPQPIVFGVHSYVGRWAFRRIEPQ